MEHRKPKEPDKRWNFRLGYTRTIVLLICLGSIGGALYEYYIQHRH